MTWLVLWVSGTCVCRPLIARVVCMCPVCQTFDLPIKSEGTMDLSDIKILEPGAKPDSSVLLPKSLVEVGKKVKQKVTHTLAFN